MIGRGIRAHARSFAGDVVLLGVVVAAFVMSLTLATNIPSELSGAPAEVRGAFTAPFRTVLAMDGAILAAVYGSFRYTIDRRDGVIAQRLMAQPRWAMLVVRMPSSALGGAIVALMAVVGGHTALLVAMGGIPVDGPSVGASLMLGALAGLWGMGIGVLVQSHLAALFLASLSLGAGPLVAMLWSDGAVVLPLLAMLSAFGFDVTAVGVGPDHAFATAAAALLSAGWVALVLLAGTVAFLRRDVT